MDRTIEGNSHREIIEQAQAILSENIKLHRTNMELRGRLKEARRACRLNRARVEEVRRWKQADGDRKQILLAACGLTAALTLLAVALAICWGWAYA